MNTKNKLASYFSVTIFFFLLRRLISSVIFTSAFPSSQKHNTQKKYFSSGTFYLPLPKVFPVIPYKHFLLYEQFHKSICVRNSSKIRRSWSWDKLECFFCTLWIFFQNKVVSTIYTDQNNAQLDLQESPKHYRFLMSWN